MAIDVESEELIHFPEARALFPKRPCMQTLHRWRLRGCRGVCLESLLIGGLRYTSREAVRRFIAALNDKPPASSSVTGRSAARRSIEAEQALIAIGS